MKLFVTGASGFIGKNFIKEAVKKGHFIFAPSRKLKNEKINNVKWLYGDFDQNWKKELKKSNVLVHLAAAGVSEREDGNLEEILEVNVIKSLKLLLNALGNKCKNFLIVSTSSEYGKNTFDTKTLSKKSKINPFTNYGISKAIFSNLLNELSKNYNCKIRLMKLFPVYGKGEHSNRLLPSLRRAAKGGKNFIVKNPSEIRDFTSVDYVSKVLIDASNFKKRKFKNFQICHISENNPITVEEFAKKYWKIYKTKGRLILKNRRRLYTRHVSNKSSVWKVS